MFDKRLLSLLGKDKNKIFFIVIINILQTLLNVLFALTICYFVERFIKNYNGLRKFNFNHYKYYFLTALCTVLAKALLEILKGNIQSSLGSKAKQILREKIFAKITKLGVRETNDLSLASITQVAVEGVEQLDLYYSVYIPQFFYAMISPFILFFILLYINIYSAIILILCVPLIPMSIVAVSKYAKKIFAKYFATYTKMGDAFLDQISGMKELKIFNADKMYQDKMNSEAEAFRKVTMKVLIMQLASTTIMDLVAYAGAGAGIAMSLWFNGITGTTFDISRQTLALFVVLVAVDFFLPLRALGSAFHISMNGATAGRKILALLDTKEPTWGEETISDTNILVKDLSFSYDGEKEILKDINLEFKKDSITAIVGKSGCGKSTILNLISGFKQGYKGSVLIGDKELTSLNRENYYKKLDFISYNSYLFHDTIRNNFKMFNKNITDDEIYNYLEMVNLKDFVLNEKGLDTIILENSANLSGGERQRMSLACHLSQDKDIYLFDEVTSNIDTDSEEIIMKNIYNLAKTKTVLLVSHRLKNVINCDNIIYLEDGKVKELGKHNELLNNNKGYANLFKTQQDLENFGGDLNE